jgi:hypothetical protein
MGHAPSEISRFSALFKFCAPLHAMSHGGGALVVIVVMGAEVLGSNPRASRPYTYVFVITFDARDLCFNIWFNTLWLAHNLV